jgi:hypothetical protein
MKSISMKLVVAALGLMAVFASPAFAKNASPANQQTTYSTMSGYDRNGAVVAIPNPDSN